MKEYQDHDDDMELHTLLSQTIHDWGSIYRCIQLHPHKSRERYYRNESPLQLSLKARERSGDIKKSIGRIDVLRALVDADPSSLHSRDEEGRSCLHTACAAGRSGDILLWLINAEQCQTPPQSNLTLRTDYPGGALPLHTIAACPSFDCTAYASGTPTKHRCHPIISYPIQCKITPDILSAYASSTIIRQAHPHALWDRDCEGETALHAAASWGNVGSVLSLLTGAAVYERDGL
ncbi:hypothetical protein ACHAXR_000360, partial [Thalassiosira sp. AJA248-18]